MARCSGCSGDRCSCVVRAGANTTVTGVGSANNPYVISASAAGGAGNPTGTILMYGAAAPPVGYLVANGAAINRVTYATLFAVIGTTYGAGDGSTTFQLPDLAGNFPLGADGTHALGAQGGAASVSLTAAHIPQHSHTMNHVHDMTHLHGASAAVDGFHSHQYVVGHNEFTAAADWSYADGGSLRPFKIQGEWSTAGAGSHSHAITVNYFSGNTGGSSAGSTGAYGTAVPTPVPTMPPWLGVTFIIKT